MTSMRDAPSLLSNLDVHEPQEPQRHEVTRRLRSQMNEHSNNILWKRKSLITVWKTVILHLNEVDLDCGVSVQGVCAQISLLVGS